MDWLRSNLHIAQTSTYRDTRSFCFLDAYPQLLVLSRTPLPLPYSCPSTNKTRHRNQQASYHCSPINTIHSIARSVHQRLRHTYSEQIPHWTHTQRSSKARSPKSLLHISQWNHNSLTNGETTPHTWIEILSLRVDLNPRVSKICASWMSVWNISANYVLVPFKFSLNWNIWNPFLKTSPLDFSGQRLGNTSLVVFLRFHSFSQVVKWPEFVRLYTNNTPNV